LKCVKCSELGGTKKKGVELSCTCASGSFFDVYTNLCKVIPKNPCDAKNISSCLTCAFIANADNATSPTLVTNKYLDGKSLTVIKTQYNTSSIPSVPTLYGSYQCNCIGTGYYWDRTRKRCLTVFE